MFQFSCARSNFSSVAHAQMIVNIYCVPHCGWGLEFNQGPTWYMYCSIRWVQQYSCNSNSRNTG